MDSRRVTGRNGGAYGVRGRAVGIPEFVNYCFLSKVHIWHLKALKMLGGMKFRALNDLG